MSSSAYEWSLTATEGGYHIKDINSGKYISEMKHRDGGIKLKAGPIKESVWSAILTSSNDDTEKSVVLASWRGLKMVVDSQDGLRTMPASSTNYDPSQYHTWKFEGADACLKPLRGVSFEATLAGQNATSPITAARSKCLAWWNSDGPGKYESDYQAALAWKNDNTSLIESTESGWGPGTSVEHDQYAVGFARGCRKIYGNGGNIADVWHICGCKELWCPVSSKGSFAPVKLGSGKEDKRNFCYAAKAIFGCFRKDVYSHNCLLTNEDGNPIASWEQLLL
jgi:hypothetical protein